MNFCRMRETKKYGRNSPQIVVPNQIKIFVRNKSDATRCAKFLSSRATSCVSELLKISHACRMRSLFFGPHKVAPTTFLAISVGEIHSAIVLLSWAGLQPAATNAPRHFLVSILPTKKATTFKWLLLLSSICFSTYNLLYKIDEFL